VNPKWSSKSEIKPGRWVFVPTVEARDAGKALKKLIEDHWQPPAYYYHLRPGGHVEALRSHAGHTSFLRVDIQDFFGSINRTRVTRCLKPMFGYELAREWANASTVIHPDNKERSIIPFGFVQSQLVASLCLAESALGRCLEKLNKDPALSLSAYVDDIIVSSADAERCSAVLEELNIAAKRSRFTLHTAKQQGPATAISAFNILLSAEGLQVEAERLKAFEAALAEATSDAQRAGIIGYVSAVNAAQGESLGA